MIDHNKLSHGFEAFVELRFAGDTKVEAITIDATSVGKCWRCSPSLEIRMLW